jgi:flagellar biosynthesis/type III secretory pathway chaperone
MVSASAATLADALHVLLQRMDAACHRLEDILHQEQLAVQTFNGAALAALTDAHATCHRELKDMEGQCRDLLRQQGVPDDMGLEAFIDLHLAHQAKQLQAVRRRLYERLSQSMHASEVNRQSMRFAFEASSAVLQTIGAIPARSTYGPGGMLR